MPYKLRVEKLMVDQQAAQSQNAAALQDIAFEVKKSAELCTLGRAVMDFGFMESKIRNIIIVLSRSPAVAQALVLPGDAVSKNLEILARLCQTRVHPGALDHWLAAVEDIKSLFEERNRIFHGMFYEHQNKLRLAKIKRGKKGRRIAADARCGACASP